MSAGEGNPMSASEDNAMSASEGNPMSASEGNAMSAGEATRAGVTVRPMAERDLPRVWEMIHGLAVYERLQDLLSGTPEKLGAMIFGEPQVMFARVAERSDGELIGYALYHHTWSSFRTNPRMWLEDLYVEESVRGTGAGAALFRAFVADALARGCHRVDWMVLDWNPARAFYESRGATPTEVGWTQYGMDASKMRELIARR
jgi:GNAT superfamily N-acetyltransferase